MWSVWVGGSEVNSHVLTHDQAISIACEWYSDGYDDVQIEFYEA